MSQGPVSWIYPPELYPLRVRGKAVALTTSANWIFNFALSYFVPPAFVNIQWKVYIIFGVFCTAMTVHVFFLFPETAGKTLEEVEEIFLSDVKPWNTHVNWDRARREEAGEVDMERKLSYAHHQEREGDESDHTLEVGQGTTTEEKHEA
jgi:MFS family permease